MSEKLKEFVEIPQEFVRDGKQVCRAPEETPESYLTQGNKQFLTRCTKPTQQGLCSLETTWLLGFADYSPIEFIQISRAVAVGFAVMGFIGYIVKLIHIPM